MQKKYIVKCFKDINPFEFISGDDFIVNDRVIVEIDSGTFIGKIVRIEMTNFIEENMSMIIRKANQSDFDKEKENENKSPEILKKAREICHKYNEEIKLLSAKLGLNSAKLVLTFSSENRVDFRNLVKDLASTFKARIELKQVGIRDEAKIIGGLGPCGRECCCSDFLHELPHTNIKMAKNQGLSLNPQKISGLCGKTMCCLSYENELYSEVLKRMPKINSEVTVDGKKGKVFFNDILKEKVHVRVEDGDGFENKICEISEVILKDNKSEQRN